MSRPTSLLRASLSLCATGLAALVSGCAMQNNFVAPASSGAVLSGKAMGGQQPVSGSVILLLAIGNNGYGQQGSLAGFGSSDANGNFRISNISCNAGSDLMMIVASGGNPGLAANTNNAAIYMTALLGDCSSLNNGNASVNINEVTTAATAYVMRPFVNGTAIGTSSTNPVGPGIAYYNYLNLVNNPTGTAPGPGLNSGVTFSIKRLNSLANSLAACVNTTGPTSAPCQTLFTNANLANPNTGNVFTASVAIASNPSANVAAIYSVAGSSPPFAPSLAAAPGDWSMPLSVAFGNLSQATLGLDIDKNLIVWVTTLNNTVEAISPYGTPYYSNLLGGSAVGTPTAIAADTAGGVSVTTNGTSGNNNLFHIDTSGSVAYTTANRPSGVTYRGTNSAVTIEKGAVNYYLQTYGGSSVTTAGVGANLSSQYDHVATAPNGTVYVSSDSSTSVQHATFSGQSISTNAFTDYQGCQYTFDKTNAYCVAPYSLQQSSQNSIVAATKLSNSVQVASFVIQPVGGNGEMDGDGHLWLPVDGVRNTGTFKAAAAVLTTPYQSGFPSYIGAPESGSNNTYTAARVDPAGNVYLSSSSIGGVTILLGAAAPTIVPLAANAMNNTFGTRP